MKFNETYSLEEKDLKSLLDSLDKALTDLDLFLSKHSGYIYKVRIVKKKDKWVAKVNIRK